MMHYFSRILDTHLWRYFLIFLGSLIEGLGYSAFIIPSKLLASGLSGIAVIVFYLTDLPIGIQLIIYNIPIIYIAYKVFGKLYAVDTIVGTMLLSISIDLTAKLIGSYQIIDDPFLGSVFGGVLVGIGCGIVFRANSNGGGFDVIGAVAKKYYSLDLGTVVFGFNLIIVLIGMFLFNISIGLYTLISMYLVGEVTNKVVAGFNRKKLVIIISPFAELIASSIMQIGRGVTFLHGEGAYSRKEGKVIFVVVSLTQVSKVKLFANAIDPSAFMIVTDTSEVTGHGFTIKTPKIGKDKKD